VNTVKGWGREAYTYFLHGLRPRLVPNGKVSRNGNWVAGIEKRAKHVGGGVLDNTIKGRVLKASMKGEMRYIGHNTGQGSTDMEKIDSDILREPRRTGEE